MHLAYLDAGSGSLIASALVGGVAAAGVAMRSARSKLAGTFSRKRGANGDAEATPAEATPEAADTAAASDA
jgi:hypothetical protein